MQKTKQKTGKKTIFSKVNHKLVIHTNFKEFKFEN